MDKRLIGRLGEKLTYQRYEKRGYKLIGLNYGTRLGEIDVVVQKGNLVVFVEVKTRNNDSFAQAREFVTYKKQQRIKAAAMSFLSGYNLEDMLVRFDVAEVYHPENNPEINIIENAFE